MHTSEKPFTLEALIVAAYESRVNITQQIVQRVMNMTCIIDNKLGDQMVTLFSPPAHISRVGGIGGQKK